MRTPRILLLAGMLLVTLSPGTATAHEPTQLRVASFNIHAGIGTDGAFSPERTADAIADLDADVVALQEVDVHWDERSQWRDLARELAERLDMSVYFGPIYRLDPPEPGAPHPEFGNALLSKHPIMGAKNHKITRLSSQEPDPEPKLMPGFPRVTIKVDGVKVRLYSTHLDFQEDPAVRTAQVDDMLRVMDAESGPQVLLGDFNATPDAAELDPLWSAVTDAWRAGDGAGHTYPAEAPQSRIDYVGVSRHFTVESAFVPDTVASDHRPIAADVTLC